MYAGPLAACVEGHARAGGAGGAARRPSRRQASQPGPGRAASGQAVQQGGQPVGRGEADGGHLLGRVLRLQQGRDL